MNTFIALSNPHLLLGYAMLVQRVRLFLTVIKLFASQPQESFLLKTVTVAVLLESQLEDFCKVDCLCMLPLETIHYRR